MSDRDPLRVLSDEQGFVRIFATAHGGPEWTDPDRPDWALPGALGTAHIGKADVQVFPIGDLQGMPLADLLAEGYGVSPDQLAAAADALGEVRGTVAILRSAAFEDRPLELQLSPELALVGIFREPQAGPTFDDLGDFQSARPRQAPAPDTAPDDGSGLATGAASSSLNPDRSTYIRSHVWLALIAMAGAMAALALAGNPHIWVGAVGGLAAIAVRGVYLASEDLGRRWDLTATHLVERTGHGQPGRSVLLSDVEAVRRLGSSVQIVTRGGDKVLLKYLADSEAAKRQVAAAAGVHVP